MADESNEFVAALRLVFERLARAQEEWNGVEVDEDRGRSYNILVIELTEEGSGRVSQAWPAPPGAIRNVQCVFADIEELVIYLNAYCGV